MSFFEAELDVILFMETMEYLNSNFGVTLKLRPYGYNEHVVYSELFQIFKYIALDSSLEIFSFEKNGEVLDIISADYL